MLTHTAVSLCKLWIGGPFIIHNYTLNEKPLQHDVVLLNLDDFQDMDIILILKVNKLLVTTTHQWWMKGRLKLFVKKLLMYFNISLTLMFNFKSIIRITICGNLQIFSSALFLNYYQIHSWMHILTKRFTFTLICYYHYQGLKVTDNLVE